MHVCLVIKANIKDTNACLSDHRNQHQSFSKSSLTVFSLPHWQYHSLFCIHVLKCCCAACRCMLGMTGAVSVMPRGIALKGMQSAAALAGSGNQTALKKTSPAGSMCQYVPDRQQSHLHDTLPGCEDKPAPPHCTNIAPQCMCNACVQLSELSADDTSLRLDFAQSNCPCASQRDNTAFKHCLSHQPNAVEPNIQPVSSPILSHCMSLASCGVSCRCNKSGLAHCTLKASSPSLLGQAKCWYSCWSRTCAQLWPLVMWWTL